MADINEPNDLYSALFGNIGNQGESFNQPLSDSGMYYAFLSKADFDESTGTWSIMFEVQPEKYTYNVFKNGSDVIKYSAPPVPASIFNPTFVYSEPLFTVLGVKDADNVAEASWYLIKLEKKDSGAINGLLYNPDIDVNPDNPNMSYGNYELISADLLVVPEPPIDYIPDVQLKLKAVPKVKASKKIQKALCERYYVYKKKQGIKRPRTESDSKILAYTAPVTSIGAMDIGQGNCNLLFDSAVEPYVYFDLGYPLWFYLGSLPANMRFGTPAYQGPIVQNTANDLYVVISHWDWDHWRLGRVANMQGLVWIAPNQPIGGSTLNFANTLPYLILYPGAPFINLPGYAICRCTPAPGTAPAALLNNTGIAMLVTMQLPTTAAVPTQVLMTGDANFDNVDGGPFLNLSGIEAAHHGSNAHGASANLPAQIGAYAGAGRVFYSYGMRPTAGGLAYVYGFPVPAAVTNYQNAGWGNVGTGGIEISTAEGTHIRALPATLANRGNVRVGDQTPLPVAYNNSAFYNFPNQVN
ncbi:hypothetical protein [Emticicia sp. 21SJ11W-3]|uniref:hypothetical protein n=1 Tax=Emticicia sp. 21SJ11W-3 TaxID=2916755 RepID=UPI00209F44C6|nr:hypothetical protein [Emticicia sp. 21SJ11W-3]UTA66201.1 hypothetical protein MB380_11325 [Emticicia sp. 21SJ11W-3]